VTEIQGQRDTQGYGGRERQMGREAIRDRGPERQIEILGQTDRQ
jgi:hypothetical protein